MLKKFFMNTLSSFVGAWIALVLFGLVAILVVIGMVGKIGASSVSSQESISKGCVMTINLQGVIAEREIPTEFDYLSMLQGDLERPQTLVSLINSIKEAKKNKKVSAIYLKCGGVSASLATLNALRNALNEFRSDGKKIIAYADNFSMADYYVASVADEICLNPGGEVAIKGLSGTNFYLKGLFDKLGVTFQVVKVGTFKSAVEPYILTEMSDPARAQLDTLYGNFWSVIRENISSRRGSLSPAKIDSLVSRDFVFLQPADFDLQAGLVDKLFYERSMDSVIGKMVGKEKKDLKFVTPSALLAESDWGTAYGSKKQVAVLYASGEIVDGGGASTINFKKLVPEIVKLAENDDVKGMVLRVNSPGGAVFGSEQIGDALDYFQSKGKTLAVSMGDLAASGGYWISCCADRIFADPLTITGSIGIFGLIPNVEGLMEKIGVSPQTVSTNPEANFPTGVYPLTETQKEAMQKFVELGYDKFVKRVAKGRNLPEARVRVIGEGRVYDAVKAKELGLVDELGGLQEAVEWVASKSELDSSYEVALYPTVESSVWDFLPQLNELKSDKLLAAGFTDNYDRYAVVLARKILTRNPIQARMPYYYVNFELPSIVR